jgi:hypothetical protein
VDWQWPNWWLLSATDLPVELKNWARYFLPIPGCRSGYQGRHRWQFWITPNATAPYRYGAVAVPDWPSPE